MNYNFIFESKTVYENDSLDTLQCDEHIDYANMWKQLCNNAIKFGIFQNTLWILGYTNYLTSNNIIVKSEYPLLKLRNCTILFKSRNTNIKIKFNYS